MKCHLDESLAWTDNKKVDQEGNGKSNVTNITLLTHRGDVRGYYGIVELICWCEVRKKVRSREAEMVTYLVILLKHRVIG